MSSNASKLQAMGLKYGFHQEDLTLKINNVVEPTSRTVKLLGVTIDERLNFDVHIDNMCKKASRQINAMSRIAKYLDVYGRTFLYNAFIMSNFQYCSNVSHFGRNSNIWKLEKINKRALRVLLNDYEHRTRNFF